MDRLLIFMLLGTLLAPCLATNIRYVDTTYHYISQRTYSEHHKYVNSVRNCTDAVWSLEKLEGDATISVKDCKTVLNNVRYNHGYYEVWGFDSDDYAPLTGFNSCTFGVARTAPNVTGGYAVVGNDDVVSVIVEAISTAKENITGATGSFTCGANNVTLSVLVYDGTSGYSGGSASAPALGLWGDYFNATSQTASPPNVTRVPTETPNYPTPTRVASGLRRWA